MASAARFMALWRDVSSAAILPLHTRTRPGACAHTIPAILVRDLARVGPRAGLGG